MRFYNQPHRFYCGVDLHASKRVDETGRVFRLKA
jgi:hypothetical protein